MKFSPSQPRPDSEAQPQSRKHRIDPKGPLPPDTFVEQGVLLTPQDIIDDWQEEVARPHTPVASNLSQKTHFIIMMAIIIIVCIVWFVVKSTIKQSNTSPHSNTQLEETPSPQFSPHQIADLFCMTTDPAERIQWVRNPEQIKERLSDFAPQALSEIPEQIEHIGHVQAQDLFFERFEVTFRNKTRRLLCVVSTENGLFVDWDCYARYGTSSWRDLLEGNKDEAKMRVFISIANYYNHHFQDEQKWQTYQLTSPDTDEIFYGYLEKNTVTEKKLHQALRSGKKRATISVKTSPKPHPTRQLQITAVETLGWVEK